MAISPSTEYPGRVTAPTTAYPYGSSKNETSPGAGDGTPYEAARANDVFGLQQALLVRSGMVPSGTADTAEISQYLDAMGAALALSANGVLAPHKNLVNIVNVTNPLFQVDIDADELLLTKSDGAKYLASAVNLTVDITASGANGLDTGTEANGTWYHLWVIWNPTTDTVAGLLSVSASAPTLPSGYTYQGYVGAVYNSSGGDFVDFYQRGREVITEQATPLSGGAATTTTAIDLTAVIPPGAVVIEGSFTVGSSVSGASQLEIYSTTSGLGRKIIKCNGGSTVNETAPYDLMVVSPTVYYNVASATDSATVRVSGWSY